jgi:hypothetical protein
VTLTPISRRSALGFLGATGLVAACGPDRPTFSQDALRGVNEVPKPPPPTTTPQVITNVRDVDRSLVAEATGETIDIFGSVDGAAATLTLSNPILSGGPLVFLVEEMLDDWIKVLLPVRPNGSLGFVRVEDVKLSRHNFRILVEITNTNLKVLREGELFFETRIAVAAENRPTPGGKYYLTELLQPPTPHSVYGTLAYGLSGFSEVLETFNGGPGQLGIHGTNDPDSIGRQVSSGCVRMVNSDIDHIATFLPLGTPVEIFA